MKQTGKTVQGPGGPITGAMVGTELHQDEADLEPKVFAPGHAEWFSGDGHDFEANALSVPADAQPGPLPASLTSLSRGANAVFEATRAQNWNTATA